MPRVFNDLQETKDIQTRLRQEQNALATEQKFAPQAADASITSADLARLWAAAAPDVFDFQAFSAGEFVSALAERG